MVERLVEGVVKGMVERVVEGVVEGVQGMLKGFNPVNAASKLSGPCERSEQALRRS